MFIDCGKATRERESEAQPKRKCARNNRKEKKKLSMFTFFLPSPFSLSTSAVEKIPWVNLEKLFPFLGRTDTEGRAKEAVRNQLVPQLLNSYQGHKGSITGLIFSERNQVLISSSDDKSVRLWHLSGQVLNNVEWGLKRIEGNCCSEASKLS
jgi:WD40 repeat protein